MTTSVSQNRSPVARRAVALALPVLVLPLVAALPASAKGGRPGVRAAGACSGPSHWKLSAKTEDKRDSGRIEVEAEVDTPANGRTWTWQLTDQAAGKSIKVASGNAVTHAPSGSFTVHRLIANRAGTDVITFRASAVRGGETCTGSVRLG